MTLEEFKEQLIVEGIASVRKHETRPERVAGGLVGFEMCRTLNSMWDFQDAIEHRHAHESDMITGSAPREKYWEYRYATVQIEYIYDRMLVVWSQAGLYSGPLSARAVLRAADIVGVKGNDSDA